MFKMFKQKHPTIKCSYDSYREIFNNKFNVSFGYPRKDTCSKYDELQVQIDAENNNESKQELINERDNHQRMADVFYNRKKIPQRQGTN